jgi:hypothetical protein
MGQGPKPLSHNASASPLIGESASVVRGGLYCLGNGCCAQDICITVCNLSEFKFRMKSNGNDRWFGAWHHYGGPCKQGNIHEI